jgi:hypothetical protein
MTLLLFNWFGYRVVSSFLESSADCQLEYSISLNQFDDNDLLKFKVPLNLPYQITDHDFKSVSGEITIGGKIYSYVKRQIINDSMTVLCLPNSAKTKLTEARNNYFSKTVDADHTRQSKSKQSSVLKLIASDLDISCQDGLNAISVLLCSIAPWHEEFLIDTKICQLPSEPPDTLIWS